MRSKVKTTLHSDWRIIYQTHTKSAQAYMSRQRISLKADFSVTQDPRRHGLLNVLHQEEKCTTLSDTIVNEWHHIRTSSSTCLFIYFKEKTPENTSYVELRVSQLFYVKLPFLRSRMNVHQIIKYLEKKSCTVPHGQQSVGQCIQGLLDTIRTMFIIHAWDLQVDCKCFAS